MSRRRTRRTPSSRPRAPRPPDELDPEQVAALEQLYAALPALACKGLCQHSCAQHVEASDLEHARAHAAGIDLTTPTPSGACPALTATFGTGHCSIHPVRPMVCRLWGIAASMPCPHGCLPELFSWTSARDVEHDAGREGDESAHLREHDVDVAPDGARRVTRPAVREQIRPAGTDRAGAAGTAGDRSPVGEYLPDADALRAMLAVLHLGGHEAAAPGMAELVSACVEDEFASALMARLLRGDTSVKPALGARLQQLRAATTPSRLPTHPARPAPQAGSAPSTSSTLG